MMMKRTETDIRGVRNNDHAKINRLRAINLSRLSHIDIGYFMVSDSGFIIAPGCTFACNIARQAGMTKWS